MFNSQTNGVNEFWEPIFEWVGIPKEHWHNKYVLSKPDLAQKNIFFKGSDLSIVYPLFRHALVMNDVFAYARINEYLSEKTVYNGEKLILFIRIDVEDGNKFRKDNLVAAIIEANKARCQIMIHTLSSDANAIHEYFKPIWDIIDKFEVI